MTFYVFEYQNDVNRWKNVIMDYNQRKTNE